MKMIEFKRSKFFFISGLFGALLFVLLFLHYFIKYKSLLIFLLLLYALFAFGWTIYVFIITPKYIHLFEDKIIIHVNAGREFTFANIKNIDIERKKKFIFKYYFLLITTSDNKKHEYIITGYFMPLQIGEQLKANFRSYRDSANE